MVGLRVKFTTDRSGRISFIHSQLDSLVSEDQRRVERGINLIDAPTSPLSMIEDITRSLYDLLNSKYQDDSIPGERIHIETCFMTNSYVDTRITISAWANDEGRTPTSLSMRSSQPDIYDRTVTADVFREAMTKRPEPRLIEDTEADANYHHLYPTQHQRIKSTIVYPVLSSSSRLLGTLVATADRRGYFRAVDQQYWFTVMNLYERRLALEFLRLDAAVTAGRCAAPF
jgi:GAF domain-containing protein